jgi:hypothetical protein
VEQGRNGETDEDDERAQDDVEDVVVRGRDDRERHRHRHGNGERANADPSGGLEEDDPEEEVPAEVEARQRRVLVRQRRRLKRTVAVRVLGHCVHDSWLDESRWGDRNDGEEDESDQAGDDHRVTQKAIPVPPVHVEEDGADGDNRPVPVDVDPVRERDRGLVAENRPLDGELPRDPELALEPQERIRVGERSVDPPLGEPAHQEVDEDRKGDQGELTNERDRRTTQRLRSGCHAVTLTPVPPPGVRRDSERLAANYASREAESTPFPAAVGHHPGRSMEPL